MPNMSVMSMAGTQGIVIPRKEQCVSTGGTTHHGGNTGIETFTIAAKNTIVCQQQTSIYIVFCPVSICINRMCLAPHVMSSNCGLE